MLGLVIIKSKDLLVDFGMSARVENAPDEILEKLGESIVENGLYQPLAVAKIIGSEKYMLVHGYQRYLAMSKKRFKRFICTVVSTEYVLGYEHAKSFLPLEELNKWRFER